MLHVLVRPAEGDGVIKLLRPHERILLVTASTPAELGRMFLRPQEFYESPRYRGRFFTHEQFKRYYKRHWGRGAFSYYRDFQGYNMPGEVFLDWQKAFASTETEEEQKLLNLLGALPNRFYLIGALERDVSTVKHELSHAFYHLFRDYREMTTAALYSQRRPEFGRLRDKLRKTMYRNEVLDDECVSYILFESAWMRRNGIAFSTLKRLREDLAFEFWRTWRCLKPREKW